MFRILALASMVLVPFTISPAIASDAKTCPNSTELINKSGVTDVELAQAIQCLTKGLENKATDEKTDDATAIIQLASKIIGNGSPVANKIIGNGFAANSGSAPIAETAADNH
ncbi:hypothetical protein SAMN04515648_0943 [Phyllobacterium sp. CL33Tsu]|uniref:hypothetical protein n=1 Tax=Phyllobacterium sp. CL33Tsu TaxID=1798191 RepID=UPI0008DFAFAC|nr:hypothetical protein [Phyllobacterium sp. CL33Tsu]SFI64470.1 hypothetical protein SAMN04515648_0943 [Phyllobacterium sp. CL33Tsu]